MELVACTHFVVFSHVTNQLTLMTAKAGKFSLLVPLDHQEDGWRRQRLCSEITAKKSAIVHLVCVIIMYTIYKMYKDVASSRSSYAIFLECRGSW